MHLLLQDMGSRYPHQFFLFTSIGCKQGQLSPVLAANRGFIQDGFNFTDAQGLIYLTECISGCIVLATLVLYGKVKVGQRSHPSMPTGIKVRGGKQVGEGVIVHLYDKWFVCKIFLEVISNGPLQPKEFGFTMSGNSSQLWLANGCHRQWDVIFHPPLLGAKLPQGHWKMHPSPTQMA